MWTKRRQEASNFSITHPVFLQRKGTGMDGCVKQTDDVEEEEQKKTIARKYFNLTHILGNGTGNTHPYFVCIESNSYARTFEFMSGID